MLMDTNIEEYSSCKLKKYLEMREKERSKQQAVNYMKNVPMWHFGCSYYEFTASKKIMYQ